MSTYLPGVTDLIPQYQPFTPNFDFYNQALQVKHAQYQAGYKQLSGLYSSLLNSPLSRDENIQRRDDFFKNTEQEIKKLSGMDLSLPQNVDAASQIFKPFYDDKPMMKDMVVTKSAMDAIQAHEVLKNCAGKDCADFKAWDTGLAAVNFKLEEFKKSGTEESLGFGKINYTPKVNYAETTFKFLKDNDFKIEREVKSGRYQITYKNGALLEGPLYNMIKTLYSDDANISDMYDTQAYVNRKSFAKGNAHMYGSEEAAEQAYLFDRAENIARSLKTQRGDLDTELNGSKAELRKLEAKIRTTGITANSRDAERYRALMQTVPLLEKSKKDVIKNLDYFDNMNGIDINTLRSRIDGLVSGDLFDKDLRSIAKNYSEATSSQTMKADEYELAAFNNALSLNSQKEVLALKFKYDLALENVKNEAEKKQLEEALGANQGLDISTTEPGVDNQVKEDLYTTNTKAMTETVNGYVGGMNNVLTKIYQDLYVRSKTDDQAKADLVKIFGNSALDKPTFEKFIGGTKSYKTYETFYNYALKNLKDNSAYSALMDNTKGEIQGITRSKRVVDAMVKVNSMNNSKIKTSMLAEYQSELDSDYVPYVKDFINNDNHVVSKDTFIKSLEAKGIDSEDAGDIYSDMLEEYSRQYSDGTKDASYRAMPLTYNDVIPGQGAGAYGAKPMFINANPIAKLSGNYTAAKSVLADISNTGYEMPEDSPVSKELVQQLIRDFTKTYDPKKENAGTPNLTMKYETISDREGYAKVTLTPDRKWLENNVVGIDKEAEATQYDALSKGFELYIPKDKANNMLEAGTKSASDIIFAANNNVVSLGDDKTGNALITKDERSGDYTVTAVIPYVPKGTREIQWTTITNSVSKANGEDIINSYESLLEQGKELIKKIDEAKSPIIRDPEEVLKQQ